MENVFEREFHRDEFNSFIQDKIQSKNMMDRIFPIKVFNMAKEQYKREQFEEKVISKMYENTRRCVKRVIPLSNDMAIIETFEKAFGDTEGIWYRVYFNDRVDSTVTQNLDDAIIRAICMKHNSEGATGWICKMLDIKEE